MVLSVGGFPPLGSFSTGLCPIFYFQHIIFDTIIKTVGIRLWVLSEKGDINLISTRGYFRFNCTYVCGCNLFTNRCNPGYYPFSCLELLGKPACSIKEVMRERDCSGSDFEVSTQQFKARKTLELTVKCCPWLGYRVPGR